jgi:hypothetical protein
MTSKLDLEKPALEGAGKKNKPRFKFNRGDVVFYGLALIIAVGVAASLTSIVDDSERLHSRYWTSACVSTVGGASGKVGELTRTGAYVAFKDGSRVWYPRVELVKSDCETMFPTVTETNSSATSEIENVSSVQRHIAHTRKEVELLKLRIEQARLAKDYYYEINFNTEAKKP